MTNEDIDEARTAIMELDRARRRNSARIEVALDAVASALKPLAEKGLENANFEDILEALALPAKVRGNIQEIYDELQNVLESRGYGDEDDEDDEEILEGLIEDLCEALKKFLVDLESKIEDEELGQSPEEGSPV